jgi:hypothetical protein
MELSKVQDGFLVEGVLVIKAQVQVIRYTFIVVQILTVSKLLVHILVSEL